MALPPGGHVAAARVAMTVFAPVAERRTLLGIAVDAMTMNEVLDRVDHTIAAHGRLRIGIVNAAKLVNMRRDDALRVDVLSCDVILADGVPVVWASRLLHAPLPERVAGIDLMIRMLSRANERRYRVYCLGATKDVLASAVARIRAQYPKLYLAGHHDGYFAQDEEPSIVADIAAAKPDILLVGMSSPKKEHFIARWDKHLDVPVCHGVGGSFDVLAGKVRRAPVYWQRLGLEWLYRVKQEPRRLWRRYLITNTVFSALVATAIIRNRFARFRPATQRLHQ